MFRIVSLVAAVVSSIVFAVPALTGGTVASAATVGPATTAGPSTTPDGGNEWG